ncbi:MAG: NAD(P)H-dependent oxidoreductase [Candidatus Omnitrophota bacterium]
MNILVLNGSPKGDLSVTLRYVQYAQKKFPQHQFRVFNVSVLIKKFEKDEGSLKELLSAVEEADALIWAFPVYYLLVPSQYKRFIELIGEKGLACYFRDKYAVSLSTSVHFFDHTAHAYMNSVCEDFQMRYAGSFSAEMYDLLEKAQREKFFIFMKGFFESVENKEIFPSLYQRVAIEDWAYVPQDRAGGSADLEGKRLVIVVDHMDPSGNLFKMLTYFKGLFKGNIEVVDLSRIDIKGGCMGCCHCGYDYTCVYQDGFKKFCDSFIMDSDILIFAGKVCDRYLSWKWKLFFDRSFFRTHTPIIKDKQVAFILEGPLSQIANLRDVLDAYVQTQGANLVGFVTDESCDSAKIDGFLKGLAKRLIVSAQRNYIKPMMFPGLAGHKLMRDCMWEKLQFPFRADHLFYSRHHRYDFPRRSMKAWFKDVFMAGLTRIPLFREKIYREAMKKEMVKPLDKILKPDKLANL